MKEIPIGFQGTGPEMAGVLRCPENAARPGPAVLIVHGTLEHDRDGNMVRHPDGRALTPRPFFRHLARRLTALGIAVFSWDKRGFGQTGPGPITVQTLYEDARAALETLRGMDRFVDHRRIAVLGQSAGVYTACQIARRDQRLKTYVLQGGLFSDYDVMMRFNFERPIRYAAAGEANRRWVQRRDPWGLTVGRRLESVFKAALAGRETVTVRHGGQNLTLTCDPTCYQPDHAPSRLFRHIQKPTLILHGENDLNVPLADAHGIERELKRHGNRQVVKVIVPGADHSFQITPNDHDQRLRERMSLDCLARPFSPAYFRAVSGYLKEKLAP